MEGINRVEKAGVKRLALLIFILLNVPLLKAQSLTSIDCKLDVAISYRTNVFVGSKEITKDKITATSLYANFDRSRSFAFKALMKYNRFFSLGGLLDYNKIGEWSMAEGDYSRIYSYVYKNSTAAVVTAGPSFALHTPFLSHGNLNVLSFSLQFSPLVGLSKVDLDRSPMLDDYHGEKSSTDWVLGQEVVVGIQTRPDSYWGFFVNCGFKACWVDSKLYNDPYFMSRFIEVGILVRFLKDKRFNYL